MAIGRDDHEAALARGDALADRVEELERELAEVKQPKPPDKPPKKRAKRAPAKRNVGTIAAVVGTALVIGLFCYFVFQQRQADREAEAVYRRALAERQATKTEWGGLVGVEPCVRDAAYDTDRFARSLPETWSGDGLGRIADLARWHSGTCRDSMKRILDAGRISGPSRQVLARFLAADAALDAPTKQLNTYLVSRDWQEDDLAGARTLARELAPLLTAKRDAITLARRVVLPELRERLRLLQAAYEKAHGQDEIWWRMELGMAWWAMNETALDASGVPAGSPPDREAAAKAILPAMRAFRERAKNAPIEIRRQLRKRDHLIDPILAGQPFGENGLWALGQHDADLLRQMGAKDPPDYPPEPVPPPSDD